MRVYLARHGDALPKDLDPDCPLSETGLKNIKRLAKFISGLNLEVATCFHSGILRAEQTAALLAKAFHSEAGLTARADLEPLASVSPIANELNQAQQDLLLVGHMPFMGKLTAKLVIGHEGHDVLAFQTGTLVCLERIASAQWIIKWILTPELLTNDK